MANKPVRTTPESMEKVAANRKATTAEKRELRENTSTLQTLVVEYVPITSIAPNNYNPNHQGDSEFELLCMSMAQSGITQPILANKSSRQIIDGEHRWHAAQVLGYTEIPVVFVEFDDTQAKISTIRHNTAVGSHNDELEAEVYRDLQRLGALDKVKAQLLMSDSDLERILGDVSALDLAGEEYNPAWVPVRGHEDNITLIQNGKATPKVRVVADTKGNVVIDGTTKDSIEEQTALYENIEQAETETERMEYTRPKTGTMIIVTFPTEDSEMILEALGDEPAERLYWMCMQEYEDVDE